MEKTKTCSKCGYTRRPEDNEFSNAPPNACPKCFSFYDSGTRSADPAQTREGQTPDHEIPSSPVPGSARPPKRNIALYVLISVAAFGILYYVGTMQTAKPPLQKTAGTEPVPAAGPAGGGPGEFRNISEIAGTIRPSVVSITIYSENQEPSKQASGFFFGGGANVVTNYHAMKGAHRAEIKTASGRTYPVGSVMAEDRENDLVMVSTGTFRDEIAPLRVSTSMPPVGEKIVVIGNPLGLEQTVSDGIISAYRQTKEGAKRIQITAPISPGSSGSPVVNLRGEVIGVAFAQVVGGQNLNFCIPGEVLARLGSRPGSALADLGSHSEDKLYCYLDENKTVHFARNPENPGAHYFLLNGWEGSPDRARFEKWLYENFGNPYRIDPQAEVESEKAKLPEHFRKIFPGYEMEQLGRFTPESRAYWGSWVANRYQQVFDHAARTRQAGIARHKQLMQHFDKLSKN